MLGSPSHLGRAPVRLDGDTGRSSRARVLLARLLPARYRTPPLRADTDRRRARSPAPSAAALLGICQEPSLTSRNSGICGRKSRSSDRISPVGRKIPLTFAAANLEGDKGREEPGGQRVVPIAAPLPVAPELPAGRPAPLAGAPQFPAATRTTTSAASCAPRRPARGGHRPRRGERARGALVRRGPSSHWFFSPRWHFSQKSFRVFTITRNTRIFLYVVSS